MTEEEKKTLVDAVNCKYPHQNLTEILECSYEEIYVNILLPAYSIRSNSTK